MIQEAGYRKKDDQKKQVKITLDHKARIQEIHLFENPADDCVVNKVKISFGNGYVMHTDELMHEGGRTIINIPDMEPTDFVEVTLEATEGELAGLTEIEIYEGIQEIENYRLPLPYGRKSLKITRRWEVQPDAG